MTTSGQDGDKRDARIAPWTYSWWVVVGGLFGMGVVGLLTIGIFLIGLGLVLALIGFRLKALNTKASDGIVAGLAFAPLYLAWLNRGGPGIVCKGTRCGEQYSPWPFVVVAVALLVGFGVSVRRRG